MLTLTSRIAALVALTSALVIAAPAVTANAVVPPPPALGEGTTGSVELMPSLEPGESVAVSTTGLSAAELMGETTNPANGFHSGVTVDLVDPRWIVVQDDVRVDDAAMVRFETVADDPSVELEMEITWIEDRDLDIGGQWVVNSPGAVERIDLPGYTGLWLVTVRQISGPAGIFVDTTAAVVRNLGQPLTLSSTTVSPDAPSVTASWSGLAPGRSYLGLVYWGSPQQRSTVEVSMGTIRPPNIPTTTTARLSSSVNTGGSTYLLTRVSADSGWFLPGDLRLRVDGVVRSVTRVYVPTDQVFKLRIPPLPPGVHSIKAEYRPDFGVVDPSNSPARRLLVAR